MIKFIIFLFASSWLFEKNVIHADRGPPQPPTLIPGGDPKPEAMQIGYDIVTKIGQEACFYEYLQPKPRLNESRVAKFGPCYLNMNVHRLIEIWKNRSSPVDQWKWIKPNIASNLVKYNQKYLREPYHNCTAYLNEPMFKYYASHPLMEEAAMNKGGDAVPYKGYANCVLFVLDDTYGAEKFTQHLKTKWGETPKWQEVALERENRNRKRHQSGPLTIEPKLEAEAQTLADKMIAACAGFQSVVADHNSVLDGKDVGLSVYLFNIGPDAAPQTDGLLVANAIYETGKDYMWPEFTGKDDDPGLNTWGQFSQSVWKNTNQVGYGMGRTKDCPKFSVFVAKYLSKGNIPGQFKDNVFPEVPCTKKKKSK